MRKRDYLFILVLLLIGYWAWPHIKEDAVSAVVPDKIERLFPRLVDRLTHKRKHQQQEQVGPQMQSVAELDRMANADPPPGAPATAVTLDHGYGW